MATELPILAQTTPSGTATEAGKRVHIQVLVAYWQSQYGAGTNQTVTAGSGGKKVLADCFTRKAFTDHAGLHELPRPWTPGFSTRRKINL